MKREILFIFIFVSFASGAWAGTIEELREENRLLEAEVKLAQTDEIYFIFDLKEKAVYVKTKGITLKKLEISDIGLWGRLPRPLPLRLEKKSALFKPRREEIEPGDAGKEDFEPDALELKDMPSRFRMVFAEGVALTVGPRREGLMKILGLWRHLLWYISRPLPTVWNAVRGKPYASVRITMSAEDARSLYWAFPEGFGAVFTRPPA